MLKVVGASWRQIQISTWIIAVVIILGIIAIILGETGTSNDDGNYSATAYWNKESGFRIEFWGQGTDFTTIPTGAARAYYRPHVKTTGWAILEVETQADYPDWVQAFAAGILEGSLSWQMIYWQWQNTIQNTCKGREKYCFMVKDFLEKNMEWVKEEARKNEEDPFWHQIVLWDMQLSGLENGYNMGVRRSRQDVVEIPSLDFWWMNLVSDLTDLEYKFGGLVDGAKKEEKPQNSLNSVLVEKLKQKREVEVHDSREEKFDCSYDRLTMASSFVRLVPQQGDIFVAHNSAGKYNSMLKMLKRYEFGYHTNVEESQLVPGRRLSFSSYPGAIHSMDDFYIISNNSSDHQLVITGTPITIFNDQLWESVKATGQVLLGPRVSAANRLATGGQTWSETAMKFNSGTGNKEWAVVDLGKFQQVVGKVQPDEVYLAELAELQDLLWVVEQVPGGFTAEDQSSVLKERTYWAGYGLPFYQNISEASGADDMVVEHGDAFSYEQTPLAQIFRRDYKNATSKQAVIAMMRSNAYKVDPLTNGNPRCAIGSRGDIGIETMKPQAVGTTDLKVFQSRGRAQPRAEARVLPPHTFRMTIKEVRERQEGNFLTIAGPAFDKDRVPEEDDDDTKPFDWLNSDFSNISHIGHPDTWSFQPMALNWN